MYHWTKLTNIHPPCTYICSQFPLHEFFNSLCIYSAPTSQSQALYINNKYVYIHIRYLFIVVYVYTTMKYLRLKIMSPHLNANKETEAIRYVWLGIRPKNCAVSSAVSDRVFIKEIHKC